jgi:LPXTG-motif cell wall-anchored protein
MQSEWENTFKPQIKEALKNARQHQIGLTEEEKKEGERMAQEFIETMEAELYPERNKKGGSAWIWILVIGVLAIGGLVGFVWYKKRKK